MSVNVRAHNYLGDQMKKTMMTAAIAALMLAGCSATPPAATPTADVAGPTPTETPTPTVMSPGAFSFENATGAKGTIQIPGAAVPEIEKLRALAGAAPTTYLTVKVDNRAGTTGVNMYGVSIFTPDGEELKYIRADNYVDTLRPSDAPAAIYNQFIDVGNRLGSSAAPKAVKDFVMVGPEVPEKIAAVTVYPTGGSNPVDATPAT